jgi:predicted nucleic acid-binding protein
MTGVIDASALIRLFIPDGPLPGGFESFMQGVERGDDYAIAPELLLAEAANVIRRKCKNKEISEKEEADILNLIVSMPARLLNHKPIIKNASALSKKHGVTVYDALYLEIAQRHNAAIFTVDELVIKTAKKIGLKINVAV